MCHGLGKADIPTAAYNRAVNAEGPRGRAVYEYIGIYIGETATLSVKGLGDKRNIVLLEALDCAFRIHETKVLVNRVGLSSSGRP